MSFVAGIILIVVIYRFWGLLKTAEASTKQAAQSGLSALVKGAARLEAVTPNLSEAELRSIREGRRQILILEDIENLSDEELKKLFETKTKAKK